MTASQLPLDQPVSAAPVGEPTADEPREDRRRRRKALLLLLLLGFLALLIGLTIWYLLFRQPILPTIPIVPDASLPHYSTSFYQVKRPTGIAVNAAGDRIYVSQGSVPYDIAMFDGSGKAIGALQPPNDGSNHVLVYPAIDPLTQEVYASDRLTGSILIFDASGRYQRTYTQANPKAGWQPLGLTFDKAGHLYVTDLAGPKQQVEEYDRQGKLVRTVGGDQALNFPNGVAVDDAGDVYVTDSDNGRLLVFDKAGRLIGQVGRGVGEGNLGIPRGIALTSDRVFVADTTGQGIFAYRPSTTDNGRPAYVGFLGGQGVADGQFQYPNGIAVDGRGRVYVADSFNDRIQVWSY